MRLQFSNVLVSSLPLGCAILGGCVTAPPPPTLAVESPAPGAAFTAGATFTLHVRVENLTLAAPDDVIDEPSPKGSLAAHEADEPAADEGTTGHIRVYLDDAAGDDPHVTAWTDEFEVVLPNTLIVGMHRLRIELRYSDGHPVGVETELSFECIAQ
jgi:hypothetical protein